MWPLTRAWYAGRLDRDFSPRTTPQNQQLFADVGLTDDFWRLTPGPAPTGTEPDERTVDET